eukprot:6131771-Pyramimonas_sp.AAC.1
MVTLECVKGLLKKTPGRTMSDDEYINKTFADNGWWSTSVVMDAVEYGSPGIERKRVWWAAIRGITTDPITVTSFFKR